MVGTFLKEGWINGNFSPSSHEKDYTRVWLVLHDEALSWYSTQVSDVGAGVVTIELR